MDTNMTQTKKKNRLSLQSTLEGLLGSRHVYYQPPESLKMEYPCIRYSKSNRADKYADNIKYLSDDVYDLVIISKTPDHPVIDKILNLPYTELYRHFTTDGLNHDIITIYW